MTPRVQRKMALFGGLLLAAAALTLVAPSGMAYHDRCEGPVDTGCFDPAGCEDWGNSTIHKHNCLRTCALYVEGICTTDKAQ